MATPAKVRWHRAAQAGGRELGGGVQPHLRSSGGDEDEGGDEEGGAAGRRRRCTEWGLDGAPVVAAADEADEADEVDEAGVAVGGGAAGGTCGGGGACREEPSAAAAAAQSEQNDVNQNNVNLHPPLSHRKAYCCLTVQG